MKKYIACLLIVMLIISTVGCSISGKKVAYCYVRAVSPDGFLAGLYDSEGLKTISKGVYIPYPDADKSFCEYDTVVIEYDEADLTAQEGIVPGFEDLEIVYKYQCYLSNVSSARLADPSKGEPTFG